jgi:hypothetical protein
MDNFFIAIHSLNKRLNSCQVLELFPSSLLMLNAFDGVYDVLELACCEFLPLRGWEVANEVLFNLSHLLDHIHSGNMKCALVARRGHRFLCLLLINQAWFPSTFSLSDRLLIRTGSTIHQSFRTMIHYSSHLSRSRDSGSANPPCILLSWISFYGY